MLDPVTLANRGKAPWVPLDGISAHPKVDAATGEMLFFNYSKYAPFMHYGVVDRTGKLVHYVPIPLPGPRLPHDMAITPNWSILNDMPLFWDEELLRCAHSRRAHSRRAHSRWRPDPLRADPAPWPACGDPLEEMGLYSHMMAYVDEYSFQSRLHRWRFNLRTGETREERLCERIVEFGMINPRFAMRKSRYVWSTTTRPGWFLFNGYVRHDTETGAEQICRLALPHKLCSGTHSVWVEHDQLRADATFHAERLAGIS